MRPFQPTVVLPADRGARLLEVHPHDDDKLLAQLADQPFETDGVLLRGFRVVHRTGPDDGQHPVVLSMQLMMNGEARLVGQPGRRVADGKFLVQLRRRDDVVDGLDACVFGLEIHWAL
jgi:hypothetical protein